MHELAEPLWVTGQGGRRGGACDHAQPFTDAFRRSRRVAALEVRFAWNAVRP